MAERHASQLTVPFLDACLVLQHGGHGVGVGKQLAERDAGGFLSIVPDKDVEHAVGVLLAC